jgi:hypothetical protein
VAIKQHFDIIILLLKTSGRNCPAEMIYGNWHYYCYIQDSKRLAQLDNPKFRGQFFKKYAAIEIENDFLDARGK